VVVISTIWGTKAQVEEEKKVPEEELDLRVEHSTHRTFQELFWYQSLVISNA